MSTQEKVKLAVVGVGNMGRIHARDVHELPHTELVAVCDVVEKNVQDTAVSYQIPAYTDYQEMLDNETRDGVIIATPHYDHPR